jgi:flagellar hook-basal body complex protein FliE
MSPGYIPPINMGTLTNNIFETKMPGGGLPKYQLNLDSDVQRPNFQNVLGNLVNNVNQTLSAPDALMTQAMTTGGVDVHDVMIANAKADLAINVTTQVATKVMQAYDKILQIQI